MTRPEVDEKTAKLITHLYGTVMPLRKLAPTLKEELVDDYCRKCDNHTNGNSCKSCKVDELLKMLIEVIE